jgi:hypothetical protein
MGQDVELWIRELEAAGWRKVMSSVWKSPSGHLFRGPYGAWCQMYRCPELNVRSVSDANARDKSPSQVRE